MLGLDEIIFTVDLHVSIPSVQGDGAIIVFDLATLTSRRYSGVSTKNDPAYAMIINGVNYGTNTFTTPSDGIALTEDKEALFYCQVQGTSLYRVSTAVLRDLESSNEDIDKAVEYIGQKEPSDGIKYLDGVLYWGALTQSTVYWVKRYTSFWSIVSTPLTVVDRRFPSILHRCLFRVLVKLPTTRRRPTS